MADLTERDLMELLFSNESLWTQIVEQVGSSVLEDYQTAEVEPDFDFDAKTWAEHAEESKEEILSWKLNRKRQLAWVE